MSKSLLQEVKRRIQAEKTASEAPKFNLDEYFFEKQYKFFRGTNKRFKVAVCSRRAGKSIGIIGDAVKLCLDEPGVRVLYITLTRDNCLEIIWPDLMNLIEDYKIPCKINQTRLTITFANKSVFGCAGAKDEREIGKFRGRKLRRIYVDEAQNFPAYIAKMIKEDLMPTLRDLRGDMIVTGTPGPLQRGFFYDISTNGLWESHTWTAFDNPHLHDPANGKDYETTLEEERTVNNIDKNNPSYIRETYGVWTEDLSALVFKFDSKKNVIEHIPTEGLQYIFGIDLGYNDADAIAVLGYSFTDDKVYLVEELITRKQGITPLVAQIEALRDKYKPVKMVMDAGALGKKIQEEMLTRFSLQIDAADKVRKFEFIELLNDDLRTGKFKTLKGTKFEEDCYLVQWDRTGSDPTKLKIASSYHSDVCFVAGTMVETSEGPVAIELVKSGDKVLTRQGFKSVEWAEKTGINREVMRLTFSDGKSIVCTGNHPIFTENRGFVNAEDLTALDRCVSIEVWEQTNKNTYLEKQSSSITQSSTDTRNLKGRTYNITSQVTGEAVKSCFTERFGSFITDLFQKSISYITKTMTSLTMTFQISHACPMSSTMGFMVPSTLIRREQQGLLREESKQLCGTVAKLESSGIENTQNLGQKNLESRWMQYVPSAILRTKETLSIKVKNISVPLNALLRTEEAPAKTTKSEIVSGAAPSTQLTSIRSSNSALVLVTREILTKKEDVYGIKVLEVPEYFANGILVHNCDSVLYAWRECRHYFPKTIKVPKPSAHSQAYMDALEEREAEAFENRKNGNDENWGVEQEDLNSLYTDDSGDL